MFKTYLLKLDCGGPQRGLRPVVCRTNAEALAQAQAWLDEHPECDAVDVVLGDSELFRVARPP